MKIQQAEELAGISKKNIRFYEKEGLLNVTRADNGYREYTLGDVNRLKLIKLLLRHLAGLEQAFYLLLGITLEIGLEFLEFPHHLLEIPQWAGHGRHRAAAERLKQWVHPARPPFCCIWRAWHLSHRCGRTAR